MADPITAISLSNHFLSFVVAEVIAVIVYNLKSHGMFCVSNLRQQQRRPCVNVIGSVIPFMLAIALISPTSIVEALSAVAPPKNNVIAITHAAGRMGKVLALQLREDAALRYQSTKVDDEAETEGNNCPDEAYLPKIRAIVRSESEAYAVKCDLGGMKMIGGSAQPIALDWLETIIIDSEDERSAKLKDAFEGCRAAILCDASHNELVWTEECDVEDINMDYCGFAMIVPASESRDLSKRLLEEIDATSYSSTLEHVVLRSTMGLAVAQAAQAQRLYMEQQPLLPFEGDVDWEALARAMGGEAALVGPREAEKVFHRLAETCSSNRRHTILRLGALTDDAGMVPLVFGSNDSILIKTDDGTNNFRPPILSRADAARVSTVLVREDDNESLAAPWGNGNLLTVDCAWNYAYGRDSVGREEIVSKAARQDLKHDIFQAVPMGQEQFIEQ